MSFWDNVKKLTQPYSDDDYDEFDDEADAFEEEQEPARRPRRTSPFATTSESSDFGTASTVSTAPAAPTSGAFSNSVLSSGNKQEVVLFHAKTFDDAAKAANELRRKKAIILNMENVDKALTRRVVDFLSGSVYALDGSVKKIAQSTYLFCPHNMDVVGDLESLHNEAESYM